MLNALIAEQKRQGLSDLAFGKSIGLRREHWNRIRHGHWPLTPRIVQNAQRAYPHLRETAAIFLLGDEKKVSDDDRKPSNIDIEATEETGRLVLIRDRLTVACADTTNASLGQQRGVVSPVGGTNSAVRGFYADLTDRASNRATEGVTEQASTDEAG